jgi:hypothetical protein
MNEAEIKRIIHATLDLPLMDAYENLCEAQVQKVARMMSAGTTVDELKKEAGL